MFSVLAINPGSTSTKIAWFSDETPVWQETLPHDESALSSFAHVTDQFEFRLDVIYDAIKKHGSPLNELSAVVGRGGIVDAIPGGTYHVDNALLERLRLGKPWEHASNLGGILADAIAASLGLPSFIVDPVSVDEMPDVFRVSGLPELEKPSFSHTLNVKATVRRAARDLNAEWDAINAIVVHLGGGCTVCAHRRGRIIDTNSGNECGPFSLERAGEIPAARVVEMCFSGKYTEAGLKSKLAGNGGLAAYLGTRDLRKVRARINAGDGRAKLIYEAMTWKLAREIGAQAVSMGERTDVILFTGGVAYDSEFVKLIQERVQWIAPCLVYPGEDEMAALVQGALRVLRGHESAKDYATNVRRENL